MDKMPSDRDKAARRLAAYLAGLGQDIARELEPRMARVLRRGEKMPDLAHLIAVLGRMVAAEGEDLMEKDSVRGREGVRVLRARENLRQEAKPLLRSRVIEVRQWLHQHYDPETARSVVDHKGRTPRDDEGLEELAERLVHRLSFLIPVEGPAGKIDPASWVAYLRPALTQASVLKGEIASRSGEESCLVEEKAQALAAFDRVFRRVVRVARIFCDLAGLDRHARRMTYEGGRPALLKKKRPATVA